MKIIRKQEGLDRMEL